MKGTSMHQNTPKIDLISEFKFIVKFPASYVVELACQRIRMMAHVQIIIVQEISVNKEYLEKVHS